LIRKQKRPICTEEEEVQEEPEKKMGFEAATSPQSRSPTISGSKLDTQKSEADHRQTHRERHNRDTDKERERVREIHCGAHHYRDRDEHLIDY
jgi:uncharacterized Zn finger protein (UPF0148 family)